MPWSLRPIADWCEEGSLCRNAVESALGGETKIVPFPWSGGNSPTKRLSASDDLRREILKERECLPNAQIHLIAHSHGGNVAFYASRGIESDITSMTCLSTPFILLVPRKTDHTQSVVSWWAIVIAIIFYCTLAILTARLNFSLDPVTSIENLTGWPTGFIQFAILDVGVMVLIVLPTYLIRKWLLHKSEVQFKLVPKMTLPAAQSDFAICLIRSPQDEAGEGIAAVRFVSNFGTILAKFVTTMSRFPNNLLIATLVISFSVTSLLVGTDPDIALEVFGLGLGLVLLYFYEKFTGILFGLSFTVASAFTLLYNGGFMLLSLRYHVAVEPTPQGKWQLIMVEHGGEGLRHSTPNNPNATKVLSLWLEQFR